MHPDDHLLLLAFTGELQRRQQLNVDTHLAGCAQCRMRGARLRSAIEAAGDAARAASDRGRNDETRLRLAQALEREARERDRVWPAVPRVVVLERLRVRDIGAVAALTLLSFAMWKMVAPTHEASLARTGVLPMTRLTPGRVSPLTATELCAGVRPSRIVKADVREQVLRDYGMARVAQDTYELDAVITPELGGMPVPENLWPQRYAAPIWNAHVKDALEERLAERVCRSEMSLDEAQRDLANDWVAAYRRHFDTTDPLPAHASATEPDADLAVESGGPTLMGRLFDAGVAGTMPQEHPDVRRRPGDS